MSLFDLFNHALSGGIMFVQPIAIKQITRPQLRYSHIKLAYNRISNIVNVSGTKLRCRRVLNIMFKINVCKGYMDINGVSVLQNQFK